VVVEALLQSVPPVPADGSAKFTRSPAVPGTLAKTLSNIVSFYQKEVDRTVEAFLSIVEPALIVFLGLIVGGLLASVLLPLYQISSL